MFLLNVQEIFAPYGRGVDGLNAKTGIDNAGTDLSNPVPMIAHGHANAILSIEAEPTGATDALTLVLKAKRWDAHIRDLDDSESNYFTYLTESIANAGSTVKVLRTISLVDFWYPKLILTAASAGATAVWKIHHCLVMMLAISENARRPLPSIQTS